MGRGINFLSLRPWPSSNLTFVFISATNLLSFVIVSCIAAPATIFKTAFVVVPATVGIIMAHTHTQNHKGENNTSRW